MSLPFLKMNGLGNDFIVFDWRAGKAELTSAQYANLANRETGIGCDQIIIIEQGQNGAEAMMRVVNQDGSEVGACGNGARCVAGLLLQESGKSKVVFDTSEARLVGTSTEHSDQVTIDMGEPRFEWQDIPLAEAFHDTRKIELQIGPIDSPVLHTPSVVNVGNPHAIFWVDDVESLALDRFGPLLENHPMFPQRANISIAHVQSDDEIVARVWERGVGLTQACGTAACAIGVAAARKRLAKRAVTVRLPGGGLFINWTDENRILMTGHWQTDFEGQVSDELLGTGAHQDV